MQSQMKSSGGIPERASHEGSSGWSNYVENCCANVLPLTSNVNSQDSAFYSVDSSLFVSWLCFFVPTALLLKQTRLSFDVIRKVSCSAARPVPVNTSMCCPTMPAPTSVARKVLDAQGLGSGAPQRSQTSSVAKFTRLHWRHFV